MEINYGLWAMFIIVFAVIGYAFYSFFKKGQRDLNAIAKLKDEYLNALNSGNKRDALLAGRDYYSALRQGKLSTYDEIAIMNDISTM